MKAFVYAKLISVKFVDADILVINAIIKLAQRQTTYFSFQFSFDIPVVETRSTMTIIIHQ